MISDEGRATSRRSGQAGTVGPVALRLTQLSSLSVRRLLNQRPYTMEQALGGHSKFFPDFLLNVLFVISNS